ncbi:MAG: DUF2924 domain-containing protein [Planctomycetales bacterium]|nr:DUF2924 domain-containing protein [Planctomycetales bacterium]
MKPKTALAIAALDSLSIDQLILKYEEVFGDECRSRHRKYLTRRIAWRMQVNDEGGLSFTARRRAKELAASSDVRVTPPNERNLKKYRRVPPCEDGYVDWDPRLPPPGNYVERVYRGRTIRVLVLTDGFEFEGKRYRTLTAIAREVTGGSYNGFTFFRLGRKPE